MKKNMNIFGPVPSRRLGKSIGINNIPPKFCSYSCVYCQLGRTFNMSAKRKAFYKPEEILTEIEAKLDEILKRNERVDYLTFVADGEPTLDINLAKEIKLLKKFGIKIAVITNSSLLNMKEVQEDLSLAHWVSFKIDSVDENIWKKIDRPAGSLKLDAILRGISDFAGNFDGELASETMLIKGVNDREEGIKKTADFIWALKNVKAYISVPTRPPAEHWVEAVDEEKINFAYQTFKLKGIRTELITGYEGNAFVATGDTRNDLLSICSVHPMREDAVEEFLKTAESDKGIIRELIKEGKLVKTEFSGTKFYLRNLKDFPV